MFVPEAMKRAELFTVIEEIGNCNTILNAMKSTRAYSEGPAFAGVRNKM